MASCKVGHVYIVDTLLTKPPKAKFALCVCIDPQYFLWINSKPQSNGRDQLALKTGCHRLVSHDSFLDLSRIVAHSPVELENAREFERISSELIHCILDAIDNGLDVLPKRHADLIKTNIMVLLEQ